MSRIPSKVRVNPHVYTLKMVSKLSDAGATGLTGTDSQELVIDDALGPTVERETVVHELLHAIWGQTCLSKQYPDMKSDSPGEALITELAPRILALLRDNPKLVDYLIERM